jgi:cold-inducible RNA-binding protein
MSNKLCVGNLPYDASVDFIRDLFAPYGRVAEVAIAYEKHNRRARGIAFVTMAIESDATLALALDGSLLEGRPLRVTRAIGHAHASAEEKRTDESYRVVQQFREGDNMSFDLRCAGENLTIVVIPSDSIGWRLEARRSAAADAGSFDASATTRSEALHELANTWRAQAALARVPPLDWSAIERALSAVRAV